MRRSSPGSAVGSTEWRLPLSSRPVASAPSGFVETWSCSSLCWHGRRTALPRHETLNAMLDWSYSLLLEREKVVLCRPSAFVGYFTLQAAGSVASETDVDEADVIDAVASLVVKSLISTAVINVSTSYRLLDTTRAYAAAKLAERGETDRISRRHAIFYTKFLEHDEIIQSLFG